MIAVISASTVVNPTYVGMDRDKEFSLLPFRRKPHVCGDGPAHAWFWLRMGR